MLLYSTWPSLQAGSAGGVDIRGTQVLSLPWQAAVSHALPRAMQRMLILPGLNPDMRG